MGSPFSVQGFLAWGLSALCALFPPGEAELLPAPFPLFPYTDTPADYSPLIPLLRFPLTLLLHATNGNTIYSIVKIIWSNRIKNKT